MDAFHSGKATTLVATDIAARGIHVDDVALVVHADPPVEHKAYLHRSGRTARAGAKGTVVTLMTDEQVRDVRDLTRAAGIKPTTHQDQRLHPRRSWPSSPPASASWSPAAWSSRCPRAPSAPRRRQGPGGGGGGRNRSARSPQRLGRPKPAGCQLGQGRRPAKSGGNGQRRSTGKSGGLLDGRVRAVPAQRRVVQLRAALTGALTFAGGCRRRAATDAGCSRACVRRARRHPPRPVSLSDRARQRLVLRRLARRCRPCGWSVRSSPVRPGSVRPGRSCSPIAVAAGLVAVFVVGGLVVREVPFLATGRRTSPSRPRRVPGRCWCSSRW